VCTEGIPCPRGDTDCHQWLHEPRRGTVLDPLAEVLYIKCVCVYKYDIVNLEIIPNKT
jgi:hypothetical protein